jgi:hypothetical protein
LLSLRHIPDRKVNLLLNLAIVISGLLLAISIVKPEFWSSLAGRPSEIAIGDTLRLPQAPWFNNDNTLVLILQRGCQFCEASAPFYRKLLRAVDQLNRAHVSNTIHVTAVLPGPVAASKAYLERMQLSISDVQQSSLASLKTPYTPTLLMVDRRGIVKRMWVGQLSQNQEEQILRALVQSYPL